jgi:hypothetical protein
MCVPNLSRRRRLAATHLSVSLGPVVANVLGLLQALRGGFGWADPKTPDLVKTRKERFGEAADYVAKTFTSSSVGQIKTEARRLGGSAQGVEPMRSHLVKRARPAPA